MKLYLVERVFGRNVDWGTRGAFVENLGYTFWPPCFEQKSGHFVSSNNFLLSMYPEIADASRASNCFMPGTGPLLVYESQALEILDYIPGLAICYPKYINTATIKWRMPRRGLPPICALIPRSVAVSEVSAAGAVEAPEHTKERIRDSVFSLTRDTSHWVTIQRKSINGGVARSVKGANFRVLLTEKSRDLLFKNGFTNLLFKELDIE